MSGFVDTLRYIRDNDGQFPPTLDSKEDRNGLGPVRVQDHVVEIMRDEVVKNDLVKHGDTDILLSLVDGFLLYSDKSVINELDIRLLVRAPYEKLKERREARSGYVTIEGTITPDNVDSRILGRSTWIL